MKIRISLIAIVIILFCSCNGVEYNKVFLNDEDMELGSKMIQSTELSSTSYREGATGGDGGSTGGGCGCN